jgi:hypothetical protein
MHDDVLALVDAHLAELQVARDQLAAARRVAPGERRAAVLHSIAVSEAYVAAAYKLVAGSGPTTPHLPDDAVDGYGTVNPATGAGNWTPTSRSAFPSTTPRIRASVLSPIRSAPDDVARVTDAVHAQFDHPGVTDHRAHGRAS